MNKTTTIISNIKSNTVHYS